MFASGGPIAPTIPVVSFVVMFALLMIGDMVSTPPPHIVFALRIATTWHPLGVLVRRWLVLRQLFERTGPLVVLLAHRGGNYSSPGCLLQYRPHCVPVLRSC